MFKRILFGYAGDQAGRDAAVLAERLARLFAGKLSARSLSPDARDRRGEVSEQRVRDDAHCPVLVLPRGVEVAGAVASASVRASMER
jgi:hypothetical protein